MYLIMACIMHIFGIHTEYPYEFSESREAPDGFYKCCVCKKNIKDGE